MITENIVYLQIFPSNSQSCYGCLDP